MGSIECMFIGEQAKKLREAAGISHKEVAEVIGLTETDLRNFENGELYSGEVIQSVYQMYFQSIDAIYQKQKKSFLGFLETFCKENDLDYDALQETYFNSIADMIVNYPDKEMAKSLIKQKMQNLSVLSDCNSSMLKTVELSNGSAKKLVEVANGYKESYHDAHQAWHRNQDMAEILINVITTTGLEDQFIEHVQEQMEMEREHDFPEHDEESYKELMHELKTHWDFLKGKE